MINYSQLLGNGFSEFDSVAEKISSAFNETSNRVEKMVEKVTIPMNIYKEEDGTQVIEIAAVGLKKEDIKLTIKTENGNAYLYIKSIVPEKSDEIKESESKRTYTVKKIKKLDDLDVRLWLAPSLDLTATTRSLENGLLTISIPVKEEEKPVELTID